MTNQAWVPSEFPPVGTICNALTETGWQQVRIVAHDGKWCIFKINDPRHDDYRWSEHPKSFETLPTQEDQAIEEMLKTVNNVNFFREGPVAVMRKLYRKGFRKQSQLDESDPATWRSGDLLSARDDVVGLCKGSSYQMIRHDDYGHRVYVMNSNGQMCSYPPSIFKFISRP